MACTYGLPVTPRRKRAYPQAAFVPDGAVNESDSSLERQSTPDVHDVPTLDWDGTPPPQDHSSRKASPSTPPSKAPAAEIKKKTDSTPRRSIKSLRASRMSVAYSLSSLTQAEPKIYYASESGCISLKLAPLFHNISSTLPHGQKQDLETLREMRDRYMSEGFPFSRWARNLRQSSARNTSRFNVPCEERSPSEKRIKKEMSALERTARHDTATFVTAPTSIKAGDTVDEKRTEAVREHPVREAQYPTIHRKAQSRVTTARDSSITTTRFSRILPFDVIDRLIEKPTICVASVGGVPSKRCSKPTRSLTNVKTRLLTQLARLDSPTDFLSALDYLKQFIDAMTCNQHHYGIATEQLDRLHDQYCGRRPKNPHKKFDFTGKDLVSLQFWLQGWTKLPEEDEIRSAQQAENVKPSKQYINTKERQGIAEILVSNDQCVEKSKTGISTQTTDVCGGIKPLPDVQESHTTVGTRNHNTTQSMAITRKSDVNHNYNFRPRTTASPSPIAKGPPGTQAPTRKTTIQTRLSSRLHKNLTPREFDPGLIYTYWITGSFGFVKIGKTSGDSTAKRLKKWHKQCGHDIEEHISTTEAQEMSSRAEQLPYVYRLEALVHEELREVQLREEGCKGCGKWHQEWFLTSPEHARGVVRKWSDFMSMKPYDKDGKLKGVSRKRESKSFVAPLCVRLLRGGRGL